MTIKLREIRHSREMAKAEEGKHRQRHRDELQWASGQKLQLLKDDAGKYLVSGGAGKGGAASPELCIQQPNLISSYTSVFIYMWSHLSE